MLKKMRLGGVMLASLLVATGCQNEEIVSNEQQKGNYSLKVSSLVDSRTWVKEDGTVVWSKGDQMYVYGKGVSGVLTLEGEGGYPNGTFTGFVFGNPDNLQWAVFGDNVKGTADGAEFSISSVEGENSNSPMVGNIENGEVLLEHLCGMVRITIKDLPEGAEIKLTGDDIAGIAEVVNGSLNATSATFKDEISVKAAAGDPTIEVPVFVNRGTNENLDAEGNLLKNFTLTIDGVTSSFSAPVAVKKLSQDAIKTFNCIVDATTGKVTGFAYAVGTEEALRNALLEGGNITLSNDIVLTKKWTAPVEKFVGTLNGNGYTISSINDDPDDNLSNLDYLITDRSEATVVNLTLEFKNGNSHIYSENGLYELNSDGETTTLYQVSADFEEETFNVPEGVTTIGGYAFASNSNIETIILPSTVTTLNDRAFRDTKASTVILNEGLTNISYQAFRNATNVKEVVIPSTVTTISKEAFQNSGITTLSIPSTVTTLEYGACRDMKELTTVTIEGENVTIPGYAFRACTKLTTVYLKVKNLTLGDGMIFTNTESNNENPNNITIYVYNNEVYNVLISDSDINCSIINVSPASTADDLSTALENGGSVILTEDVTAPLNNKAIYGTPVAAIQKGGVIDGNGNTLYIENPQYEGYAIETYGGTIRNLTIDSQVGRGIVISSPSQDVYIENVVVNGPGYALNTTEHNGKKMIVTNTTLKGWISFAGLDEALFKNCIFGENASKYWQNMGYEQDFDRLIRPYVNTDFIDCEFEKDFYIDLSALENNCQIKINNCQCENVVLTNENYMNFITIGLPDGRTLDDCVIFS